MARLGQSGRTLTIVQAGTHSVEPGQVLLDDGEEVEAFSHEYIPAGTQVFISDYFPETGLILVMKPLPPGEAHPLFPARLEHW